MGIFRKLQDNRHLKKMIFIWGIKSYDDLSSHEANLHTMNDVDIVYDGKTKKYYLGIETIYKFSDEVNGEIDYIRHLFNSLTMWMHENEYATNYRLGLFDVFTNGLDFCEGFDSIEELYAYFKIVVIGFCKQISEVNED